MTVLRVRHHVASINVNFKLSRFIADWPTAQQTFIGGIADRFHDWHPIHPRDFSVTPALSLEDLRCKCQLFEGACSIVLAPDSLQLSFAGVKQPVHPNVLETIKRSEKWLSSALDGHEREWFSFHTRAHLQALDDGAVDIYLDQFVSGETNEVVKSKPNVRLVPSTHMILSDEEETWELRRMVEKSAFVENGIFMDTWVQVRSSGLASFDDHIALIEHLDRLADRAVGLQCEEM